MPRLINPDVTDLMIKGILGDIREQVEKARIQLRSATLAYAA